MGESKEEPKEELKPKTIAYRAIPKGDFGVLCEQCPAFDGKIIEGVIMEGRVKIQCALLNAITKMDFDEKDRIFRKIRKKDNEIGRRCPRKRNSETKEAFKSREKTEKIPIFPNCDLVQKISTHDASESMKGMNQVMADQHPYNESMNPRILELIRET